MKPVPFAIIVKMGLPEAPYKPLAAVESIWHNNNAFILMIPPRNCRRIKELVTKCHDLSSKSA